MAINWTNVTSPSQLMHLPNTNTGGWFWVGMLYMVWFILTAVLLGFGFERAIITSSLIALIMAILLTYANLIAWSHCLFFLGMLVIMFIYIMWAKPN